MADFVDILEAPLPDPKAIKEQQDANELLLELTVAEFNHRAIFENRTKTKAHDVQEVTAEVQFGLAPIERLLLLESFHLLRLLQLPVSKSLTDRVLAVLRLANDG